MFCDLVGSTELSERFDPEILGEIYTQWQDAVVETIATCGGHVADYRGDGVFVYFGFPSAYEDGSERAVRASLALVAMLDDLNVRLARSFDVTLRLRIGLHTGLVLLSDLGGKHAQQRFAFGETPNIAARIQALAAPNEVLVSATVATLSHGAFDFEFLGDKMLKGLSRPVGVHRAIGERDESLVLDSDARGTPSLVARDAELRLLRRHLAFVLEGHGQAVLLSGEAGIGKSRLLSVLAESALESGAQRMTLRCSAYHATSALHPIVDLLRRRLNAGAESPLERHDRVGEILGIPPGDAGSEIRTLFGVLLGVDPAPEALRDVPAQTLRARTLDAIVDWLFGLAAAQPVFLAIEDIHWADPSTLETIGLMLDRLAGARVFLALTFRPEFEPQWKHRSYASHFMLGRLTDGDARELVRARLGEREMPADVIDQIVARADGVPLFIEEIVASALELGDAGSMRIPATLQDSLMARFDRLAEAREIAQLAAVLGRESYDLIRAVTDVDDDTLRAGLAKLVASEYFQQRGQSAATATYHFRHALMRDIAYDSMLRSRRAQTHAHVAAVLETRFAGRIDAKPEIVAYHYTEGNERGRVLAVRCRSRAGTVRTARSSQPHRTRARGRRAAARLRTQDARTARPLRRT
jgi:class 3 adenylate cyclase